MTGGFETLEEHNKTGPIMARLCYALLLFDEVAVLDRLIECSVAATKVSECCPLAVVMTVLVSFGLTATPRVVRQLSSLFHAQCVTKEFCKAACLGQH